MARRLDARSTGRRSRLPVDDVLAVLTASAGSTWSLTSCTEPSTRPSPSTSRTTWPPSNDRHEVSAHSPSRSSSTSASRSCISRSPACASSSLNSRSHRIGATLSRLGRTAHPRTSRVDKPIQTVLSVIKRCQTCIKHIRGNDSFTQRVGSGRHRRAQRRSARSGRAHVRCHHRPAQTFRRRSSPRDPCCSLRCPAGCWRRGASPSSTARHDWYGPSRPACCAAHCSSARSAPSPCRRRTPIGAPSTTTPANLHSLDGLRLPDRPRVVAHRALDSS